MALQYCNMHTLFAVREEAVKLVGSFVLKGFDISAGYMDALITRLR